MKKVPDLMKSGRHYRGHVVNSVFLSAAQGKMTPPFLANYLVFLVMPQGLPVILGCPLECFRQFRDFRILGGDESKVGFQIHVFMKRADTSSEVCHNSAWRPSY